MNNLYPFKELKIYNKLPDIKYIPSQLSPSILKTKYFISSWVKHTELNNLELFDKKLKDLIEKDQEKDSEWKKVDCVICYNIELNEIYFIEISTLRSIIKEYGEDTYSVMKRSISKFVDFYIPRSVWWKSQLMLEKRLFNLYN